MLFTNRIRYDRMKLQSDKSTESDFLQTCVTDYIYKLYRLIFLENDIERANESCKIKIVKFSRKAGKKERGGTPMK